MAGNRKYGFRRGNASGRNGNHPSNWFCDGCQREHGYKVASWGTLDGKRLCSRQYEKAAQPLSTADSDQVLPKHNHIYIDGYCACGHSIRRQ
jgi:hypothetical protein